MGKIMWNYERDVELTEWMMDPTGTHPIAGIQGST